LSLGETDEAERALLEIAAAETSLFGPESPLAAETHYLLGTVRAGRGDTSGAVFFLKLSVAASQKSRGAIDPSEEGLRRSYFLQSSHSYRLLFDQLVRSGRTDEAMAVMWLMKEEEMRGLDPDVDTAAGEAQGTGDGAPGAGRGPDAFAYLFEGSPEEAAGAAWLAAAKPAAFSGAPGASGEAARETAAGILEVTARLPDLLQEGSRTAAGPSAAARAAAGTLEDVRRRLSDAGGDAALVCAVSAAERLYLVTVTEGGTAVRVSETGSKETERLALEFRALAGDRSRDPRQAGKRLHDAVMEPVAGDLEKAGTRIILLSMDGALRYVPFAALWDGERWLAERYPTAIFSRTALERPEGRGGPGARGDAGTDAGAEAGGPDGPRGEEGGPGRRPTARALGVTAAWPGFQALPGVASEIEAIVGGGGAEGVMEGQGLLDADFDRGALSRSLASDAPVVHVASHFVMDPESLARSALLLGDGTRVSLGDLKTSGEFDFTGLDMLTLSACDTGSGARKGSDGREVESLGEIFLREGAGSVLATLLPVDDMSTPELMREFYRLHYAEGLGKAEALRGAQLKVMRDTDAKAGPVRGKLLDGYGISHAARDAATVWEGSGFTHPYYWAPFVIMGGWR
ncbi:MAG: CHAT domain-containing protein, partial [Deltaproteobacteria bacterium]|nr:CHAT domain-containing protein [Deltaproteobacteria bacterium]